MGYIIGFIPVIIDLVIIYHKGGGWIFTIPLAFIVGMILMIIYKEIRISNMKSKGLGNSQKCKEMEDDVKIGVLGIIATSAECIKDAKDCIKDIADVDKK